MAHLRSKSLFFTTSPRTPSKMIPEIKLLCDHFSGQKWNRETQAQYIDLLTKSDFFEGVGSPKNKEFSARDRINRAPKSLGFVNLTPTIELTDAGRELIYGKRPQVVFLRQLLKFQFPSPYHLEADNVKGTFRIRPYLEIIRFVRELGALSFDELKIFVLNLTDFRKFDDAKNAILAFRFEKEAAQGQSKQFIDDQWTKSILRTYAEDIESGKTKTRETKDADLKKFVNTKKHNARDYADACFRYLRYTGLVSISNRNRSISVDPEKQDEVDYILESVSREPVFVDQPDRYKAYLFNSKTPKLSVDHYEKIKEKLVYLSRGRELRLSGKNLEELKDLLDVMIEQRKQSVVASQIETIKSCSLRSDIFGAFREIMSDGYYDAPLMLEYNTWRAMTMLDGGDVKGNFKFDDMGRPLSTAPGNMPDIECDYGEFALSVEVTMQLGQRQYESEGEPVARHLGQMKKRLGKDAYCLFIAPKINLACLAHFFLLNKLEISYYGGKSKIIPLNLRQFERIVDRACNFNETPAPSHIRLFLDSVVRHVENAADENDWAGKIERCVENWLAA